MDDCRKKDDHQTSTPTGAAGPVFTSDSSASQGSTGGDFPCQFPGCGRSFPTKIGRGVHHQKVHKNWYDAEQKVEHVKGRWNTEESALLARQEARLVLQGSKFLNQDLLPSFPGRTLESIKGQRRKAQHKALVIELIEEMRPQFALGQQSDKRDSDPSAPSLSPSISSPPDPCASDLTSDKVRSATIESIEALARCESTKFNLDRLEVICQSLRLWNLDRIYEEISLYLLDTFPIKTPSRKINLESGGSGPIPRRKARRAEYSRVQNLWKKNRSNCLRGLLKDKRTASVPPEDIMIPFWERIMTRPNTATPGIKVDRRSTLTDLWSSVVPREIKDAFPPMGSSPGPDGFSAKDIRAIPLGILARIFNIFILCGRLPQHLLKSKTTLIPKKEGASDPGQFRPITVSSIFVRTFHKILANRMSRTMKLDSRQKAFRPVDGCSENIFLMDFVLRYCRQNFKPLFMASLDVAKAFDSVTHNTILDTLRSAGVPTPMIEYLAGTYERSVTRLCCSDWQSHDIHPTCGVKQGDPLSPMIFNLVVDRLFGQLPPEVGLKLGGVSLNAMGFADDLVLIATTSRGLQLMLDITANYLQQCGLSVNASKCFTVALRNVPKEKKSVVDAKRVFRCLGRPIPALKRADEWKYLGVPFTPEGRLMGRPLDKLKEDLSVVAAAPLKPQQRLYALRTVILPSLYHQLVLGRTNVSLLNKLDTVMRSSVRKWLALPHDVPSAYFHADVKDGGLSLPSLRWIIPLQRFHRLRRLRAVEDAEVPQAMKDFVQLEVRRMEQRLTDHGQAITTMTQYKKRQAKLLYKSNDGRPLERSRDVICQHRWITDGNLFLSGRDFVNMNKLRINAIPLRSRMARGRVQDRHCRAGCNDAETLHHVLQICHRTHAARIKRHDACVDYLVRHLSEKFTVIKEPKYTTSVGILKPDLLIRWDTSAAVVDAQVVGERAVLEHAHQAKIDKYKILENAIKAKSSVDRVEFTSLTLSSRGLWSKSSLEHLIKLGLLKTKDAKTLSTRVLIGGLHAINIFNRTTAVLPRR